MEFKGNIDKSQIVNVLDKFIVPEFSPKTDVNIPASEEEAKKQKNQGGSDEENKIKKLLSELPDPSSLVGFRLCPIEFEKDDDTNFHIDFVTACSNMRAWNYRIKQATRLKVKVIAGKIIAALASTTAMITGLTALEFYKIMLDLKKVPENKEAKQAEFNPYYNANINLAIAKFDIFASNDPKKNTTEFDVVMQMEMKAVPDGWTSWDYVTYDKVDATVEEFINDFPKIHYGVQIDSLSKDKITQDDIDNQRAGFIYESWSMNNQAKYEERKKQKLIDVYQEVYGEIAEGRSFVLLGGIFTDDEENEVKIPPIKFIFKK